MARSDAHLLERFDPRPHAYLPNLLVPLSADYEGRVVPKVARRSFAMIARKQRLRVQTSRAGELHVAPGMRRPAELQLHRPGGPSVSLGASRHAGIPSSARGQAGRPSKSLTLAQVEALLAASADHWMHAYVALCVGTGIRTEEIRVLEWSSVDLEGNPDAASPVPPSVQVWRSVRARGDVKTEKSRRTLALPQLAVDALRAHSEREKRADGLVFATRSGRELDAANVRREFRRLCTAAGVGPGWTPRELRHSAISPLSLGGLPVEEIARIAGHSSTRTTEVVYGRELRPVITGGAQTVVRLLGQASSLPQVSRLRSDVAA